MFCSIHNFTFLMTHKNLRINLFWVFRKKETFASAIFGKIYIACTVNSAGKLICQHAWLHNSVLQGISPTLKYWPHLFSRRSPQKILNPSDPPPPCPALHFMSKHPQNFGGISPPPPSPPPPWNVPSPKKAKTHFLKKPNILFPTMK